MPRVVQVELNKSRKVFNPPLRENATEITRMRSTLLKELTILSTINGNANIYTLRNGEAIPSPYRNLLTL